MSELSVIKYCELIWKKLVVSKTFGGLIDAGHLATPFVVEHQYYDFNVELIILKRHNVKAVQH